MDWPIKIERVKSTRDRRRELRSMEEEAARLKLQIAAARFDLKFKLSDHPYAAAAGALCAGFAVGYSPGLRQALLQTGSRIAEGLLDTWAGPGPAPAGEPAGGDEE